MEYDERKNVPIVFAKSISKSVEEQNIGFCVKILHDMRYFSNLFGDSILFQYLCRGSCRHLTPIPI